MVERRYAEFIAARMIMPGLVGLLLLLSGSPAVAAQATLDRTTIGRDESVWLIIDVETDRLLDTPDISQLTLDFEILDSQRSSRDELLEQGRMQWRFELMPRRAGRLELPAFSIDGRYATPSLVLEVLPQAGPEPDVFIEIDIEPPDPYVMAQVHYRERIFVGTNLHDVAISRRTPFEHVLIHPLGDFQQYVAQRDGRNYRVSERRYALIPERSGPLPLPPLSLRARVLPEGGRDAIDRGRLIERHSTPPTLQVRPRPSAADGGVWLPSAELRLEERWTHDPPRFEVGMPITRTLILEARGIDAVQLPTLEHPELDWARVYPEPEQLETRHDNGWLIGQQTRRMALVPGQAGSFTLPAVELRWWDTRQDRPRTARLPARHVEVGTAGAADSVDSGAAQPLHVVPAPPGIPMPDTSPVERDGFWPMLSTALLGLWLLTLIGWWRERQRHRPHRPTPPPPPDATQERRALRTACRHNQPAAAAGALLGWAAARWSDTPPVNLRQLAERIPEAHDAIMDLDRHLYGRIPSASAAPPWDGKRLWQALKSAKLQPSKGSQPAPVLPPLYPQRG